jgi:hypothetical protein
MGEPVKRDGLLRQYGGLEGLAEQIGQRDQSETPFAPAANENAPPKRVALWQWLAALLRRR